MKEEIGLIGIGLVGTALARRLLDHGFGVVGFDIDAARCRHLETLGGQTVDSPKSVAGRAERILLSLMTTDIVREVLGGANGILEADTAPACIIDTTTGDPEETTLLAREMERRGIALLDATISGSSRQVAQGDAVFMVGGDRGAFEWCQDLFRAVSDKVFYLGPSGHGCKAKLASNLILGLNRLALAEGLVFAEKLGLDLEPFLALLKASPAYSVAMDVKGKKMLEGDFSPQARLRQHRKDVAIILKYAQSLGQALPLSRLHLEILDRAIEAGDGDLDNSALIRQVRRER